MEFDNIETIKRAIEIDAGVALLPEPTVLREVEAGTLVDGAAGDRRAGAPAGHHSSPRQGAGQHHAAVHRAVAKRRTTVDVAAHADATGADAAGRAPRDRQRPAATDIGERPCARRGNGTTRRAATRTANGAAAPAERHAAGQGEVSQAKGNAMRPNQEEYRTARQARTVRSGVRARRLRRGLRRQHARRKEPPDRALGPGDSGQSDAPRRLRLRSADRRRRRHLDANSARILRGQGGRAGHHAAGAGRLRRRHDVSAARRGRAAILPGALRGHRGRRGSGVPGLARRADRQQRVGPHGPRRRAGDPPDVRRPRQGHAGRHAGVEAVRDSQAARQRDSRQRT